MKKLLIIFGLLFSFNAVAQEYILEIMGDIDKKEITLKNSKYSIIEAIYKWKDSEGQYGKGFCYGSIKTKDNKIDLFNVCEFSDSEGDKFWQEVKRNIGDTRGVGNITYIQGTGKYERFVNKECKYGVAWFDESSFITKQICNFN